VRAAAESLIDASSERTDELAHTDADDLTEVVDYAVSRLDGAPSAEDIENTLRVAWIVDWIAAMHRMLQRIEQPLAAARAPAHRRWWQ
jgi:hypothetical protein